MVTHIVYTPKCDYSYAMRIVRIFIEAFVSNRNIINEIHFMILINNLFRLLITLPYLLNEKPKPSTTETECSAIVVKLISLLRFFMGETKTGADSYIA